MYHANASDGICTYFERALVNGLALAVPVYVSAGGFGEDKDDE